MRRAGRERIINALLAAPCVNVTTFFEILPDIDRREQEKRAYQIYVTDALKIIGGLNVRYVDILQPKQPEETPEEIIERIKRKLKGGEQ